MRTALVLFGALLIITGPSSAGRNAHGSLIVHTAEISYTADPCGDGYDDPEICENAITQSNVEGTDATVIWFIAAFPDEIDPAVTGIYFGHDHSLPESSHLQTGVCGPAGTSEMPDPGWPDIPTYAGNAVFLDRRPLRIASFPSTG